MSVATTGWEYKGVTSAVNVASGNLALSEPSSIRVGDLLVACIAYRGNAAFTVPAGWTKIAEENTGDAVVGAGAIGSAVMAYIVRGSSAPSFTFTRTGGDGAIGSVIGYAGNSPTPLDVFSQRTLAAASATVTAPSITTTIANALIISLAAVPIVSNMTNFRAVTDPTGQSTGANETGLEIDISNTTWIERRDTDTSAGADVCVGIGEVVKATAGATGELRVTASSATVKSAMIVAAFKPWAGDQAGINVSKLTGYAITGPQPAEMAIHKLTGYTVAGPPADHVSLSKLTGYAVAGPPADHVSMSKLTGYAVMDTSLPDYTPPAVGAKRRIQNVNRFN